MDPIKVRFHFFFSSSWTKFLFNIFLLFGGRMNRIDSTENNTVRNRIKLFNHNLSPLEKRKIPFWLLLAAARIYLLSRLPFCFFFFFFFFLFDNLAPASSPMKCRSLAKETRDIYYPLRLEEKKKRKRKKISLYPSRTLCVCMCVDSPSILSPD